MMTPFDSQLSLNKVWRRALIVGAISSVGLLSGQIPELSRNSLTLVFSSAAYAQSTVSNIEVTRFAQVVWEIEPTRRSKMKKIQDIVGSKDIPDIVCGIPKTITSLPSAAQPVARELCDKYVEVITNNKLTPARFYEISGMVSDPDLEHRIQLELIAIQKSKK